MSKFRYTFRGVKYDEGERIVLAQSEVVARHKAMVMRWGEPSGIYLPYYKGVGLNLISVERVDGQASDE